MNAEYLLNNGWTKLPSGTFINQYMNPRFGGHTLKEAIERQNEDELIDKNGVFYFYVQDNYGFGYRIRKYVDKKHKIKDTEYTHLTKDMAKMLVTELNENINKILPPEHCRVGFNYIVIFKEKHGDRYFLVHNREELEKVALKIVKERNEEGWYNYEYELPTEPKMTVDAAVLLGMERVIAAVKEEWNLFSYNKKQYELGIKMKAALEEIEKYNNGAVALQFLNDSKDGQYEAFKIEAGESYE